MKRSTRPSTIVDLRDFLARRQATQAALYGDTVLRPVESLAQRRPLSDHEVEHRERMLRFLRAATAQPR